MDIENYLIIRRDKKTGVWIDDTKSIDNYKETPKGVYVKYAGKSDLYGPSKNYKIYSYPKTITEDKIIYKNGIRLEGKIIDFEDYIKVIDKDSKSQFYPIKEIEIADSISSHPNTEALLSYLQAIAKEKDIEGDKNTSPDEDEPNFLSNQINNLEIGNNSVLGDYLTKSDIRECKNSTKNLIFPFNTNLSQQEAVRNALKNSISVIDGPPGTGKTETILSLIANIVYNDKTVAVVSNNNSAIKNVYEKLDSKGLSFFTAELGRTENREKFFKKDNSLPNISILGESYYKTEHRKSELEEIQKPLEKMLAAYNKRATLKEEISQLSIEQKHFEEKFSLLKSNIQRISIFNINDSKKIKHLFLDLEKKPTLIHKLKLFLKYSVYRFEYINSRPIETVNNIKKAYYDCAIKEKNAEVNSLESLIRIKGDLGKNYSQYSDELFKAHLYEKYSNMEIKEFSIKNYKYFFQNFINRYPVIFSTTHSILKSIPKSYLFDYLIIDEASQVDLVTATLAMSCCRNIVVVGDMKQLSPIINSKKKELYENLYNSNIDDCFKYTEHSILSSLISIYKESLPRVLLKEHYRCHPKIIGFCNQAFYNNELIIMTKETSNDAPFEIIRKHSAPIRSGSSYYSQNQIDQTIHILKNNLNMKEISSVGVISPYKANCIKMEKHINEENIDKEAISLEVDTIHKFQGREKDYIIFSTVINKIKDAIASENDREDFVDNEILINVAVSRAKKRFTLLISNKIYKSHNSNLGKLIRYIEYNFGRDVTHKGYINSIFDLLYSDSKEDLKKFKKKAKIVSRYDSENIFNDLLTRILNDNKYNCFSFIRNYRLYNLIDNNEILTLEEQRFALHDSHIDFFIYNKIDKEPVIAIEINGVRYHKNNPIQQKRDALKEKILNKLGIELISFFTDGSEQEKTLTEALNRKLKADDYNTKDELDKNVREQNEQGQDEQKHL